MGIKDLSKLIADRAPKAIRTNEMKAYFGRKVAIDASMSIYQFLIAVRHDGSALTNADGEATGHLMGMFYRTIRMIDNGIKPCYVFDGKPPEMKSGELEKRTERRAEAEKALAEATEKGDTETIEKFERRLVKVSPAHNDECKRLLRLMGVPVVDAPCEAEAQCAALARAGKVFATATEDMDALTFGSTVLLRHMTFSEAKKMPIKEFDLSKVLREMDFTHEQFIDLCILLGCDYCPTIRGIGPKRAFELMQQYGSIESILENIDTKKYVPPENWKFAEARQLFLKPEVSEGDVVTLEWKSPDTEGIVAYMVGEKNFNEDRIRGALAKLQKSRQNAQQGRIDSFFTSSTTVSTVATSKKRKAEEDKAKLKAGAKKKVPMKKK
ncbi:hypothetical protein L596_009524 [Steinernema carpocapsae]|uniref:Flap endonuclease 1 n=1 Tax=Steinernema carpocapsae TaxID=34508 RepID=A0A4U5PG48_STECR|nr:hypothetical protein L596_009524 [Steinernema carpocapsae]